MQEKRSLLPDSCLSDARGPRRSNGSHFSPSEIMNASSPSFQVINSSVEWRRKRDSNRLNIGPLKNIEMPIRWITKSRQFRISIHVRRTKTHFQVRATGVLQYWISSSKSLGGDFSLSNVLLSNLYLHWSNF